jgi:hypothetical protein
VGGGARGRAAGLWLARRLAGGDGG